MILTSTLLGLLPFVAADGLHRLPLKKMPSTASNPSMEAAYLAEKYGGVQAQVPLMGAGGSGRRVPQSDLFRTQEEINGGHNVPLSSEFFAALLANEPN